VLSIAGGRDAIPGKKGQPNVRYFHKASSGLVCFDFIFDLAQFIYLNSMHAKPWSWEVRLAYH
jgi:hypothetical protein